MDIIKLQTRKREGVGKSYTRKARTQGWVPANYYGHGQEATSIEVSHKEFATLVRNKQLTHLVDLGLEGGDDSIAVIREVQRNVLKDDDFYHIDFMHVAMNETVVVDIPLELSGTPVGVKVDKGVLGHPIKSVKVECLPKDIPEKITVDVTELKINESIHARDISVPDVVIKDAPEEVVAVVTPPTRVGTTAAEEEGAVEEEAS
ncbi:MAG: 50S ribosomal protein L25 [Chitinispirillaceae bacterium]